MTWAAAPLFVSLAGAVLYAIGVFVALLRRGVRAHTRFPWLTPWITYVVTLFVSVACFGVTYGCIEENWDLNTGVAVALGLAVGDALAETFAVRWLAAHPRLTRTARVVGYLGAFVVTLVIVPLSAMTLFVLLVSASGVHVH